MLTFAIGAETDSDKIYQKIISEFNPLTAEGVKVDIGKQKKGGLTFLNCKIIINREQARLSTDELCSLFKHYIASGLAEYILWEHESGLINRIIKTNFDYFSKEEQMQLAIYTFKILNEQKYRKNNLYRMNRKNKIVCRILEYLDENEELIITGFINFRLKDYYSDLEEAVKKAVDEYLMEKEYQEFIRLLRYFVDIQEPRINKVHVIIEGVGLFKLLDQQKQVINNDYLEDFILDIIDSEINYDDLLISALITIAPGNIVLHCSSVYRELEVVETILSVFTGKVSICSGCKLCGFNQAEQLNLTPQRS